MKTNNAIVFEPAIALLAAHRAPLFISHEYTDADDLGGMLALAEASRARGIAPALVAKGGVDRRLRFLPGSKGVSDILPSAKPTLIVFFGCGKLERTGFPEISIADNVSINIDHHPDNPLYGTINLVDAKASSTSEIVYHMILRMQVGITKTIATNLLAGIASDTGGFRHANTTAEVLALCAELIRRGARIDRITEHLFGGSDYAKMRAWAKAFENARFDPEQQIIYSMVTEAELAEIGASPDDLDGAAEMLNTVPDAKFAMLLKERDGEVRGSLRSDLHKGVDVSAVARAFGGGGHKLAAGFKFKGKVERTADGWKIT